MDNMGLYKKTNIAGIKIFIFCVLFSGIALSLPFISTVSADTAREQEIREKTEKILSLKEFAPKKRQNTVLETIAVGVKDIVEKIKQWIKELFDRTNLSDLKLKPLDRELGPVVTNSLKITGIIIILSIIILLIVLISRNFRSAKKLKQKEDAELLSTLKDADLVEQKALDYFSKNDYRQAIRFLYIALLLKLNEVNIIRIDKSKTNKQYLKEIREDCPGIYDRVSSFTQDFNIYWYGTRKAERERFEHWHNIYNLLKKEVEK